MRPILIQGDAYKVMHSLPSESFDCIITDPPYGCGYEDKVNRLHELDNSRKPTIRLADASIDLQAFASAAHRLLKDGGHAYIFWCFSRFGELKAAMRKAGFKYHQELIWAKTRGTIDMTFGYGHMGAHEMVLFCMKGRRKLYHQLISAQVCGQETGLHPTQKPIELIRRFLWASTLPGDKVIDPFMGSGSVPFAAYTSERIALGIELDAEHYATAARRCSQETLADSLRVYVAEEARPF